MQLPKKLTFAGGGVLAFSVIFGFFGFDQVLKFGIRDQTALKKRNEIYGIYLKLPFPLDFRVYFFNISNPDEVQNGATPILKEVGPYCYDEYKEKVDIVENEAEDSLTYSSYDIFTFNENKSGALRDDDYVSILHPLIVGMVNTVAKDSPPFLSIVNKAIRSLFREPKSIYLTAKVKDILFDGVEINCKVKDFSSKAVCTQIKQQIPGLKTTADKNVYLFSLLGPRNATLGKRIKILRGIKKSKNLGKLMEVDDEKVSTLWGSTFCNRYKGTDGWIFPPMLTKEEGLWSYSADLCRNVHAKYVEDTVFKGINVWKYYANLGDMSHNDEDKCYCSKECLRKGLMDLTKCMGVPIYASLPHFLEADEIFLTQVHGMKPVVEDHIVRVHFEAMTGTPIEGKKRMQFNLQVQAVPKISLMKTIPTALHPIFWIEEGLELDGPLLQKVANIFLVMKLLSASKWVGMASSGGLLGLAGYLHFKNRRKFTITPVHSVDNNKDDHNDSSSLKSDITVKKDDKRNYINHAMSGHELDKY